QDTDAPDPGRCHLHHARVSLARVHADALERAVLFRRYLIADHRGGDHGLHGTGPGLHDVPPVRLAAQEGQLQGREPAYAVEDTWQKTTSFRCRARCWKICPTQLFASSSITGTSCSVTFRARCACITSGFFRATRSQ